MGTAFKNVESYKKKEGIKKDGKDNMVHLSADLETAKNVATRHSSKYVILEIDTEAMLKENYKFYLSENKSLAYKIFVPSKFIKILGRKKWIKNRIFNLRERYFE